MSSWGFISFSGRTLLFELISNWHSSGIQCRALVMRVHWVPRFYKKDYLHNLNKLRLKMYRLPCVNYLISIRNKLEKIYPCFPASTRPNVQTSWMNCSKWKSANIWVLIPVNTLYRVAGYCNRESYVHLLLITNKMS